MQRAGRQDESRDIRDGQRLSPLASKGEGSFTFAAGKASVSGSNNGAMKLFDAATTTVKVKNAEGRREYHGQGRRVQLVRGCSRHG